MKKQSKILIGLSCLAVSGSVLAAPSFAPGSWGLGLGAAYYRMSSNHQIKHNNTTMPYITGIYNINQAWGVQALIGRLTNKNSRYNVNQDGWMYMVDGVYRFSAMPKYKLQPYAIAGLGMYSFKKGSEDRHNPLNVNAGVGVQYFLSDQISVNANVRDIYQFNRSANDIMLGVGFDFSFGGDNNAAMQTASAGVSSQPAIPANTGNSIAHFALNSAKVTSADKASIKAFAAKVKAGETVKLSGYADDTGSDAYNQFISQKRADSVKYYLQKDGVKGSQIVAKGYGNTNPAADNTTQAGRAQNRRVTADIS